MDTRSSKSSIRRLEDRKDVELARRARKMGGRAKTIAEVKKILALRPRNNN